jgi:CTP:phosphocholine cytidylyltransferase-like protein
MQDTYLGETTKVIVKSDKVPVSNVLKFEKDDENLYSSYYTPKKIGFEEFFNAILGVNYPLEYKEIGFNKELRDLVSITGGQIFEPTDIEKIVEFIKESSVRKKTIPRYWRWPIIGIALIILLIEIFVRKIVEAIRREK